MTGEWCGGGRGWWGRERRGRREWMGDSDGMAAAADPCIPRDLRAIFFVTRASSDLFLSGVAGLLHVEGVTILFVAVAYRADTAAAAGTQLRHSVPSFVATVTSSVASAFKIHAIVTRARFADAVETPSYLTGRGVAPCGASCTKFAAQFKTKRTKRGPSSHANKIARSRLHGDTNQLERKREHTNDDTQSGRTGR